MTNSFEIPKMYKNFKIYTNDHQSTGTKMHISKN